MKRVDKLRVIVYNLSHCECGPLALGRQAVLGHFLGMRMGWRWLRGPRVGAGAKREKQSDGLRGIGFPLGGRRLGEKWS